MSVDAGTVINKNHELCVLSQSVLSPTFHSVGPYVRFLVLNQP